MNKLNSKAEREVGELVAFFASKGFHDSSQVSNYIRANKLGYKFPNISGFLELSRDDKSGITDTWVFEGGIAPRFYREICKRLGLANRGSRARVTGFKSYGEKLGDNLPLHPRLRLPERRFASLNGIKRSA